MSWLSPRLSDFKVHPSPASADCFLQLGSRLLPIALDHQANTVWFIQINFSRIFLLIGILICLLVLFWFWTKLFWTTRMARGRAFPSLHHLCLWFLKEHIHVFSHLAWSVFCFVVFSLSAFPNASCFWLSFKLNWKLYPKHKDFYCPLPCSHFSPRPSLPSTPSFSFVSLSAKQEPQKSVCSWNAILLHVSPLLIWGLLDPLLPSCS